MGTHPFFCKSDRMNIVKLPGHTPGLPGNVISFHSVPLHGVRSGQTTSDPHNKWDVCPFFHSEPRTHYSELLSGQPEVEVSSFHVHPFQPDTHFISDPEGLVRPLPHQAVAFLVVLVVIIVKAGHPNE